MQNMYENRHRIGIVAVVVLAGLAVAADPEWRFDQVVLTNGAVLRGLILEETPTGVRFQNVRRAPGRPTVSFTTTLTRGEIAAIQGLPAAAREQLAARLKELEEAGPA